MRLKFLLIFFFPVLFFGQDRENINIYNNKELWFKTISMESKISKTLDSLVNLGYYTLKLDSVSRNNKELNVFIIRGRFYKETKVQLDSLSQEVIRLKRQENYTTTNLDSLVHVIHYYYLKKGYAFNRVTTDLDFTKQPILADVRVELNNKRSINSFVIEGFSKIPKGVQKDLEYEFIGKEYEDRKLKEISNKLSQTGFIIEERSPQVLFTPDSTTVFLYLKKRKASSFDGILGFGSDEKGKFKLNGQLALLLGNVFNSFETINFNWLATADEYQNFNINVNVPYLFKSKFGSETSIIIQKQDSTFANVNLSEHIYYQYTLQQRMGLEFSFENSRYVLEGNKNKNNFSKTGIGLTYQYLEKSNYTILGNKNLYAFRGMMLRNIPEEGDNSNQYTLGIWLEKLIRLSGAHYLKGRISAETLLSDTYIVNELYKIGGLTTIRGFNEQAIYASSYLIGSLEYRYIPFEELYLTLFADVAFTENKYQKSNPYLVGTGLGISFLTRFGTFTLNYAIGKYNNQSFDFSDSKVHIGIQTNF